MGDLLKVYLHPNPETDGEFSRSPKDLEKDDSWEELMDTAPIVHSHEMDKNDEWTTLFIQINDAGCKELLTRAGVTQEFAGIDDDDDWKFFPKYRTLIPHWQKVVLYTASFNESWKAAAKMLVACLDTELQPYIGQLAAIDSTGLVAYENLWHLFPAGALAVTSLHGATVICQIIDCHGDMDPSKKRQVVRAKYVDRTNNTERAPNNSPTWDFVSFGIGICHYEGVTGVTQLPIVPLKNLSSAVATGLKERAAERALQVDALDQSRLMDYDGLMAILDENFELVEVSGRVVIDVAGLFNRGLVTETKLGFKIKRETQGNLQGMGVPVHGSWAKGRVGVALATPDPFQTSIVSDDEGNEVSRRVPVDDRHLCVIPWVYGFHLAMGRWGLFHVDKLSETEWDAEAFGRVMNPAEEKALTARVVESKVIGGPEFDASPVKDKGIFVLIHGPSGYGKTFTAHAIAEHLHVAVYELARQDLGSTWASAGAAIDQAVYFCKRWNAMLLIENVDNLIGAVEGVSGNDFAKFLVAKMNRHKSLCVLTMRYVHLADEALLSRVVRHIPFRRFTDAQRMKLWCQLIDILGHKNFDLTELDDYLEILSDNALGPEEIENVLEIAIEDAESADPISIETLIAITKRRVRDLRNQGYNRMVARAAAEPPFEPEAEILTFV